MQMETEINTRLLPKRNKQFRGANNSKKVTKILISRDFSENFCDFWDFFRIFGIFGIFFQDFFRYFSKTFGIFGIFLRYFRFFSRIFKILPEKCDKDFFELFAPTNPSTSLVLNTEVAFSTWCHYQRIQGTGTDLWMENRLFQIETGIVFSKLAHKNRQPVWNVHARIFFRKDDFYSENFYSIEA